MIKLSESKGFGTIPEGEYVFKVEDVQYDEDFGIIEMDLITEDGKKHREKYNLLRNDGEINEGALNVFSYVSRTLLQDFSVEQIDHQSLIGKYMKASIVHNKVPSTKKEGEFMTFVNLNDVQQSDGFEGEDSTKKSLDDLLK